MKCMKGCLKTTTENNRSCYYLEEKCVDYDCQIHSEKTQKRVQDSWDNKISQVINAVIQALLQTISAWLFIPFQWNLFFFEPKYLDIRRTWFPCMSDLVTSQGINEGMLIQNTPIFLTECLSENVQDFVLRNVSPSSFFLLRFLNKGKWKEKALIASKADIKLTFSRLKLLSDGQLHKGVLVSLVIL